MLANHDADVSLIWPPSHEGLSNQVTTTQNNQVLTLLQLSLAGLSQLEWFVLNEGSHPIRALTAIAAVLLSLFTVLP